MIIGSPGVKASDIWAVVARTITAAWAYKRWYAQVPGSGTLAIPEGYKIKFVCSSNANAGDITVENAEGIVLEMYDDIAGAVKITAVNGKCIRWDLPVSDGLMRLKNANVAEVQLSCMYEEWES